MTGLELYELWMEAMAEEGIDAGGWDDLADEEQAAWERTASQVRAPA